MVYPGGVVKTIKDRAPKKRFGFYLAIFITLAVVALALFLTNRTWAATEVSDTQVWTGTKTIDGNLTIHSNGKITGTAGQFRQTLRLKVNGDLTIDAGGSIDFSNFGSQGADALATDASGKPNSCHDASTRACAGGDYAAGISGGGGGGFGGGGGGAAGWGSRGVNDGLRGGGGGGYFGQGGSAGNNGTDNLSGFNLTQDLYGVVGGGGATNFEATKVRGGTGGGAAYIEANNIVINGAVISDGEDGSVSVATGGGAGTIVVVAKETIRGAGRLSARGGDGQLFADSGGAGGGGLISVRYAISKQGAWETNSTVTGGVAGMQSQVSGGAGKLDIAQGLPTGVGGGISIIKKTYSSADFNTSDQTASFNSGSKVYVKLEVVNASDGSKSVNVTDEKIADASGFGALSADENDTGCTNPTDSGGDATVNFNNIAISPGTTKELCYQFKAP